MTSRMDAIAMVLSIIAEETARDSKASVDEITRRIKVKIDRVKERQGFLSYIPPEYLKNLVRKKMKENELTWYSGDPEGRDDKIREELREIEKDIQRTRPDFLVINAPLFFN